MAKRSTEWAEGGKGRLGKDRTGQDVHSVETGSSSLLLLIDMRWGGSAILNPKPQVPDTLERGKRIIRLRCLARVLLKAGRYCTWVVSEWAK